LLEKGCVLAILLAAMFAADWRKFRKAAIRGLVVYFMLFAAIGYCGLLFVLGTAWPGYTDLLRLLFGGAARSIVDFVKTPA
jgi:hypothetical protein